MASALYRSAFVESFVEAGKAEGRAEDVIKILDARGIELAGDQRERVTSCSDLDQLDLWFDRALPATSAADVFKD